MSSYKERMCCHLSRFCQDRLSQNSRHHLKSCLILYSTGTVWTPFSPKLPLPIQVWCIDAVFPETTISFPVNGLALQGRLKRQKNKSGEVDLLYWTSYSASQCVGYVQLDFEPYLVFIFTLRTKVSVNMIVKVDIILMSLYYKGLFI